MKEDQAITLAVVLVAIICILFSAWILYFNSNSSSSKIPLKCYDSECPHHFLSNEIISADFSGKYVKVGLLNGTEITTDCLTARYSFTQNATSWWCGNEIHTIQYKVYQ